MMQHDMLRQVSLLVFANKQDLPKALPVVDIIEALGLHKLQQKWYAQGCCAVDGQGLQEGFEKLTNKS